MNIIRSRDFTATRAWGPLPVAEMNGITTRLHWTDQPYQWHTNDGQEVFVVLDGRVEMRYRQNGAELATVLETGDISTHLPVTRTAPPYGPAPSTTARWRRLLRRLMTQRSQVQVLPPIPGSAARIGDI